MYWPTNPVTTDPAGRPPTSCGGSVGRCVRMSSPCVTDGPRRFPHQLVVPAPVRGSRTSWSSAHRMHPVRGRGTGAPSRNWCENAGRRARAQRDRVVRGRIGSYGVELGRTGSTGSTGSNRVVRGQTGPRAAADATGVPYGVGPPRRYRTSSWFPHHLIVRAPDAVGARTRNWCGGEVLVRGRGTGARARNWCAVDELVRGRETGARGIVGLLHHGGTTVRSEGWICRSSWQRS
jgi:hypothetical protein